MLGACIWSRLACARLSEHYRDTRLEWYGRQHSSSRGISISHSNFRRQFRGFAGPVKSAKLVRFHKFSGPVKSRQLVRIHEPSPQFSFCFPVRPVGVAIRVEQHAALFGFTVLFSFRISRPTLHPGRRSCSRSSRVLPMR